MLDATEKTNSLRTLQKKGSGEDGGDKIQITGGRETPPTEKGNREDEQLRR